MLVASLQCAGQNGQIFNIFVDHLVAKFSDFEPGLCRIDPTQSFRFIQVVDGRTGLFGHGRQQLRLEFIA